MIFKLNLTLFACNIIAALLLAAFYYSPMHAEGEIHIPHTQASLVFGKQVDYSQFIIPASALRIPGKKS